MQLTQQENRLMNAELAEGGAAGTTANGLLTTKGGLSNLWLRQNAILEQMELPEILARAS